MPNLLATRNGRLTAFFFLYLTEGVPLGFTATAIATEMRRQGLGPEAIGAFVGSLYLPWAWKWLVGPFVDVFAPRTFGRRRAWIVGAQLLMMGTLVAAMPIDFVGQLSLFTALIFLHNLCGATQDVAIDALACETLKEDERGLANGLMFSGAYLGQSVGGSGVLYLKEWLTGQFGPTGALQASFGLVILVLALVMVFVSWQLKETPPPERPAGHGAAVTRAAREVGAFARDAFKSFFASRPAFLAVAFALLPAGAMGLGLALASNLMVELGLKDDQIATLNLWTTVISAAFCVIGGRLGDVVGRRLTIAVSYTMMGGCAAYLGWQMHTHGWITPLSPEGVDFLTQWLHADYQLDATTGQVLLTAKRIAPAALVTALWVASFAYAVGQGLSYGTKAAVFMDVTNPLVAATQFTAYMAMCNFTISYSARWLGWAAEAWGYPKTLMVDAAFGLVALAILPFMVKPKASAAS